MSIRIRTRDKWSIGRKSLKSVDYGVLFTTIDGVLRGQKWQTRLLCGSA